MRSDLRRLGFWLLVMVLAPAGIRAAQTEVLDQARSGDMAALHRWLNGGEVDPNLAEPDQTTLLHWAVLYDDREAAEKLLALGADATLTNRLGVSPLHLAATNGNASIVRLLLEAGADPDGTLPGGETILMTAARTGDVDAIRTLLDAGAEVNARESWRGQTALMWAAAEDNADAIRTLLAAGAERDAASDGGTFTPFLFAVRGGHIDAAGALLDAGVDPDSTMPDGMSALVLAILNGHYELAGFLLDRGADPNADAQGWTALHQIAWTRRPNAGFNLPGASATGNLDSLDLARKLVAQGADIDRRMTTEPADGNRNMLNRIGSTPFLMAAKSDDVALMRVLLELGSDPSIPNEDGTTALMVAAGVGIWAPGENPGTHQEALAAVKLALEVGGGEVNDIDDHGETAVHGAVYRGGAIPVIDFLASQGARLDVVNEKGWTPLVAAEGVEYTPTVLKRYPEAAERLRELMRADGIRVPEPGRAADAIAEESASGASSLDGVFTEAQALRGRQVYRTACASCHLEDLGGDQTAAALTGDAFWERWRGSNLGEMFEITRTSMPLTAPQTLPDDAYRDLLAYILSENGSPPGPSDLPDDAAHLGEIRLEAPAGR